MGREQIVDQTRRQRQLRSPEYVLVLPTNRRVEDKLHMFGESGLGAGPVGR